jgi:beta-N-acetylhexosaminidase
LEAGALSSYGSTGNRAVSAAKAGMDLILCSARDVSQGEAAMSALSTALGNGTLDATTFQASLARIDALRSSLP